MRYRPEGTLLDRRYRLLRVVGGGRTGRVYLALHVGLGAYVALKELRAPVGSEARVAFLRGARALTTLGHPNLARVRDYFVQGDRCFLVSDFVEGETLAAMARRLGPLPLPAVLGYGLQLCDALAYLHRRDPALTLGGLAPSDVVVTRAGWAILVDLGLARRGAPARACATPDPGPDLARLAGLLRGLLFGATGALGGATASGSPPEGAELLDEMLARCADGRIASAHAFGRALQAAGRALLPSLRPAAADDTPCAIDPASLPPGAHEYGAVRAAIGGATRTAPPTTAPRGGRRVPVQIRRMAALGAGAGAALLGTAAAVALAASLAAVGPPSRAQSGALGSLSSAARPPAVTTPATAAASTLAGPPSRPNLPALSAGHVIPPTPTPPAAPPTSRPTVAPVTIALPVDEDGDDEDGDDVPPVPTIPAIPTMPSIPGGGPDAVPSPAPTEYAWAFARSHGGATPNGGDEREHDSRRHP